MNTNNLKTLAQLAEQLYCEYEGRYFKGDYYDHDYTEEQLEKNRANTLEQIKHLITLL